MATWMHHHIQVWLEVRDWWHRQHLVNNRSHLLLYVWLPACVWTNSMLNDMLPHSWFLLSDSRDALLTYLITYITTYFLCEHVQTKGASDGWANMLHIVQQTCKGTFFFSGVMERLTINTTLHDKITRWVVRLFGKLLTLTVWGELQENQWQAKLLQKLVFTCFNDVRLYTYAQLSCQNMA